MADTIEPDDNADVEAHSVLDAQGLDDDSAEVEAHSCCSTISTSGEYR